LHYLARCQAQGRGLWVAVSSTTSKFHNTSPAVSVALFDSGIDALQLPLQLFNSPSTDAVAKLVRRFFEWHAIYSKSEGEHAFVLVSE